MTMFTAPASLTTANAHLVLQEGLAAIAAGQLVFDFAATGQTDSAAVAMLLAWQRAAKARGATLELCNLPASVQSLAALYDVAALLAIPVAPEAQTHFAGHAQSSH
jgi:phospholipid transport system transporter-binding protein